MTLGQYISSLNMTRARDLQLPLQNDFSHSYLNRVFYMGKELESYISSHLALGPYQADVLS